MLCISYLCLPWVPFFLLMRGLEKKCSPLAGFAALAIHRGNSTHSTRFRVAYWKQLKQYFFYTSHERGNLSSFRAVRQAHLHTWLGCPLHRVDLMPEPYFQTNLGFRLGEMLVLRLCPWIWRGRMWWPRDPQWFSLLRKNEKDHPPCVSILVNYSN